tara:strand:+ start:12031 stop:13113 length:1083 start_codon:yes stop_codon:yes gene_type:complete
MEGGKLLATGSGSCILDPEIPCKGTIPKKNRISKLIYHKDSEEMVNYEMDQVAVVSGIKGYKKWSIIYDESCISPPYKKIIKYDPKGIKECLKDQNYNFNTIYILNSIYGGETMEDIFINTFETIHQNNLEKDFINFMVKMEPLFLGLTKMDQVDFVHNDIKHTNIVHHKNKFKYIDFGLSSLKKYKNFFMERSLSEYKTERIYYFYPLEYLYFYNDKQSIQDIKYTIEKRKNFDLLRDLYKIFNFDIYDSINDLVIQLLNNEIKEVNMINKIDVYSLGLQIPLLFYKYSKNQYPYKESFVIADFYNLFKKMINPNNKLRISADEAYSQFSELLQRYKYIIRKKSTKKKKKTMRKKKKRV